MADNCIFRLETNYPYKQQMAISVSTVSIYCRWKWWGPVPALNIITYRAIYNIQCPEITGSITLLLWTWIIATKLGFHVALYHTHCRLHGHCVTTTPKLKGLRALRSQLFQKEMVCDITNGQSLSLLHFYLTAIFQTRLWQSHLNHRLTYRK